MVKSAKVIAIIPARGGSKGIFRKNIKDFAGYPLIAYSIAAGLSAKMVDRVIVSTDDEEIAKISRECGAEVPFLRPAGLAKDDTTDLPVIQHALDWLTKEDGCKPEIIVQLRPTSPIRPRTCVDDAVNLLLTKPEVDCVRGVVPAGQNPYKMWKIEPKSERMVPLLNVEGLPEPYNAPRQILPKVYWQTGHVDAIRTSCIINKNSLTGENIHPLIIDSKFTVDIDNPFDWNKAEWLVWHGGLDMVDLASRRRPLPQKPRLLVMDFDGVLTDNRVWVDEEGRERVAANRSDSLGLRLLRQKTRIDLLVISMETNPVVAARCKKLDLPFLQGINDKASILKQFLSEKKIDPDKTIYMGNDINDLSCFVIAGCAVAPMDALPEVKRKADLILSRNGGHGAVRELCDLLLRNEELSFQL